MRFAWIGIGVLAFLLYTNTFQHGYVWDDVIVITENQRVQQGIGNIKQLFVKNVSQSLEDQYGYRPITLSSFALDISLFGRNPHAAHIVQALYYSLLCMLLCWVLTYLFGQKKRLLVVLACLLFVVHPTHVEVVANIKSRDEILALLFAFASLAAFIHYNNTQKWVYLPLSALFYALAVLSRESAFVFIGIFPIVFFWQYKQKEQVEQTRQTENTPHAYYSTPPVLASLNYLLPALTALAWVAVIIWNASFNTLVQPDYDNQGWGSFYEDPILSNSLYGTPFSAERIATSILIAGQYLKNFFLPHPLVYFYGYEQIPVSNFGNPYLYCSIFAHLGLLFYAIWNYRKRDYIPAFALLYYAISIFIFLQIALLSPDTMADRYLFTPSLGLCLLLAHGLIFLAKKMQSPKHRHTNKQANNPQSTHKLSLASHFAKKLGLPLMAIGICGSYSFLTWQRNEVWKDNLTLTTNDLPYMPNCSRAHYYYANELSKKYHQTNTDNEKQTLQTKIIQHYKRAIEISPLAFFAYANLSKAYADFGQSQEAWQTLQETLRLFPDQAIALHNMGAFYFKQNDFYQAIPYLEKAQLAAEKHVENNLFLAWSYFRTEQIQKAIQTLENAIAKTPQYITYYGSLSDMYAELNEISKATQTLQQALQQDPNSPLVYQKIILQLQAAGLDEQKNYFIEEAQKRGIIWQ